MSGQPSKAFGLIAGVAIIVFGLIPSLLVMICGYDIMIKFVKRPDGVNERRDG